MKNPRKKMISDILISLLVLTMLALVITGIVIKRNRQAVKNEVKKESMHKIQTLLEEFYEENSVYPPSLYELSIEEIDNKEDFIYLPNHNFQMYVLKSLLENPKKTESNVFKKDNVWYYELNSMQ
jgi:type II secretory pathway pseudopilin PulG